MAQFLVIFDALRNVFISRLSPFSLFFDLLLSIFFHTSSFLDYNWYIFFTSDFDAVHFVSILTQFCPFFPTFFPLTIKNTHNSVEVSRFLCVAFAYKQSLPSSFFCWKYGRQQQKKPISSSAIPKVRQQLWEGFFGAGTHKAKLMRS